MDQICFSFFLRIVILWILHKRYVDYNMLLCHIRVFFFIFIFILLHIVGGKSMNFTFRKQLSFIASLGSFSLSLSLSIYIYRCVCVCVALNG